MSIVSKYLEKSNTEFVKEIIKEYMKKNKMDTIEEFKKINPTIKEFAMNSKYENYVPIIQSRWKSFRDNEFQEVLEELQKEEDEKKKLNTDNITTTTVNGKEIATVTDEKSGKQMIVDNTYNNRDISNQMEDVQKEHEQFQSLKENNTEGVMEYMEENVKITPDTVESKDIEASNVENNDEEKMISAIKGLEKELGYSVDVDKDNKIIIDRHTNTIYSIEKRDESYIIIPQTNELEKQEEPKKEEKGPSLTLKKDIFK